MASSIACCKVFVLLDPTSRIIASSGTVSPFVMISSIPAALSLSTLVAPSVSDISRANFKVMADSVGLNIRPEGLFIDVLTDTSSTTPLFLRISIISSRF